MGQLLGLIRLRPIMQRHGCVAAWCATLVALGPAGPDPQSGLLTLACVWSMLTVLRVYLNRGEGSHLSPVSAQVSMGMAMSICWASQAMCLSDGTPHLLVHMILMLSLPAVLQWGLRWMRPLHLQLLGLAILAAAFMAASTHHLSISVLLALLAWGTLSQVGGTSPFQTRALQFIGPTLLAIVGLLSIDLAVALSIGLGLALLLGLASLKPNEERLSDPLDQSPHGLHPEDAKA